MSNNIIVEVITNETNLVEVILLGAQGDTGEASYLEGGLTNQTLVKQSDQDGDIIWAYTPPPNSIAAEDVILADTSTAETAITDLRAADALLIPAVEANTTKLSSIEDGATADMTGAEIASAYEKEPDTNKYTDAEKAKLAAAENYIPLTDAEIKTQYENNLDTNAFTDYEKGKLNSLIQQDPLTDVQIKTQYENNPDTNAFTDLNQSKLAGVEDGATADMTEAEIETAYESNTNTNKFTDLEKTKLAGIGDGATSSHPALSGRYDPDQHSIDSITGLADEQTAQNNAMTQIQSNLTAHENTQSGNPHGVTHSELNGRADVGSHPTAAITGLDGKLASMEADTEAVQDNLNDHEVSLHVTRHVQLVDKNDPDQHTTASITGLDAEQVAQDTATTLVQTNLDTHIASSHITAHSELSGREEVGSHPTASITGLDAAQASQDAATALVQTNLTNHMAEPDAHTQYMTVVQAQQELVQAGYGGIGQNGDAPLPDLSTAWATYTGFNQNLISVPSGVIQDYPNNQLGMARAGVWLLTVKLTLTHNSSSGGRRVYLRFWNTTTNTAGTTTFAYGIARNSEVTNINIPAIPIVIDSGAVGDMFSIQLGGGDDISSVVAIGGYFSVVSASELNPPANISGKPV